MLNYDDIRYDIINLLMQEKFMEQRQKLLADTGRDQLTTNEEDVIFESVMDPAEHGRRYGFGNLAVNNLLFLKILKI